MTIAVKERPILFSAPMVRALLAGTKTQTRRKLRIQPKPFTGGVVASGNAAYWDGGAQDAGLMSPYGGAGDRLWVRETFARESIGTLYRASAMADDSGERDGWWQGETFFPGPIKWTPAIHIPRAFSRIALEVTGLRVERLQAISEADALAEGIVYNKRWEGFGDEEGRFFHCADPRRSYEQLWEHINGDGSWDANPWVWVVEFRQLPQAGDSRQTEGGINDNR